MLSVAAGRPRPLDDAAPPFTLTALDYTLIADGDNAKLEVTETIARSHLEQNVLRFNMRQAGSCVKPASRRKYNVRSVTDEQGDALPFDHDMDDLVVARRRR